MYTSIVRSLILYSSPELLPSSSLFSRTGIHFCKGCLSLEKVNQYSYNGEILNRPRSGLFDIVRTIIYLYAGVTFYPNTASNYIISIILRCFMNN
jgi:hypothetical protein